MYSLFQQHATELPGELEIGAHHFSSNGARGRRQHRRVSRAQVGPILRQLGATGRRRTRRRLQIRRFRGNEWRAADAALCRRVGWCERESDRIEQHVRVGSYAHAVWPREFRNVGRDARGGRVGGRRHRQTARRASRVALEIPD